MAACTRDLVGEYGERDSIKVFQEGKIEERIPSYIDELYYTNKTEGEETKQAYSELQNELTMNKEAKAAWDIVARGKGENMEGVMDAAHRLDVLLGGDERELVSARFWGWVRKYWKKIVKAIIIIVRAIFKSWFK